MVQSVAIIDYGSGNLRSAAKALMRAAKDSVDSEVMITADPYLVARADRIVLPGVGAFADCMRGLTAIDGMREALEDAVLKQNKPFLGICVGMQLMASHGFEHGVHEGLGWIPGDVKRIEPEDPALKVPHMGWNEVIPQTDNLMLRPFAAGTAHAYFVHSYRIVTSDPAHTLARADYGGPIAAVIGRDNLIGTQFHPEKSQEAGLAFLAEFLRWRP
jgi:imidazole glycerol-phosphate synthase subunit HisH